MIGGAFGLARNNDLISEIYNGNCKSVLSYPQKWQAFLQSACRNYKLRYDEQLLVYAQRPDATAVLEIERWNGSFGRWVNRGAKGIAVFADENRERQRLTHYFDISDTHESRYSRPVPLWNMRQEYEADVIETLESTFGEFENKNSLAEAIMSAARNAAEDHIPDYLQDLFYSTKDSFLEEIDEDVVTTIYKNMVANSVAYMMMSRLGIDTESYFEDDDFRDVTNFNTQETLNALGFATSDIAEMGLSEISKTVMALSRQNRIIAGQNENEYNKAENKTERSFSDERTDIHNGGRLQPAESGIAATAGSELGTLRSDEKKVSEGTAQSSVLQSSDEGRADEALGRGGAESNRDGGNASETDGGERGSDGAVKGDGYDEMGSSDERTSELGSGNREDGSDFRLEYYDRKHEDNSLPFFGGDDTIREILATTPHLKADKNEIRAFYESVADEERRTEYVKGIFNNDYTELILGDGRRVGYKTYQNVLHLWEGSYISRTKQSFYNWGVIAKHFEAMRLLGELQDTMKPLPSIDGQMSLILDYEAEVKKSSAFTFSQEIIDAVLTRGSGMSEGKMRIYEQFQKSLSRKENADFLKNEYGWGGSYPIIIGTGIDEQHDGKGIRISKGIGNDKPHILLNWNQVEKRIGELIKIDRYLNPKEKERYPKWLADQEVKQAEIAERLKNREILSTAPSEHSEQRDDEDLVGKEVRIDDHLFVIESVGKISGDVSMRDVTFQNGTGVPINRVEKIGYVRRLLEQQNIDPNAKFVTETENIYPAKQNGLPYDIVIEKLHIEEPEQSAEERYEYHLGDKVYIGAAEYEILSFDDNRVMLYDYDMPLFNKEFSRTDFDKKVRENPMNEHLIVKKVPAEKRNADVPYTDAFFVNPDYETVTWMYYNPDSTAGGQYVTNTLIFAEVAQTAKDCHTPDEFFDRLGSIANQTLADVGTEWFAEAEKQFLEKPDFAECNEATMQSLIAVATKLPVYDRETEILYDVLDRMKIDDITLDFDENGLVARDEDNEWHGAEFYHFLVDEAFVFNDKGGVDLIDGELFEDFKALSEHNGVEVKDNRSFPFSEKNLLDEAKQLIDEFCREEYEREEGADYSNLSEVNLAYTTTEDDKHEIQANVNLETFTIETLVDNIRVRSEQYEDLADLVERGLPYLDFNELVYVSEEEMEYFQSQTLSAAPAWEKKKKVKSFDLHPDVPMSERHTFNLKENEVETVGKKERFRRNMDAISVLKECEFENRFATPEEQLTLSKYVGWGGLSEAFDENNAAWADEFVELYTVLSPEEYASARESTLTAFYTSPEVITAIYKAMENMGFKEGNLLEPSCGIGNFIGMLPDSMKDSRIYGVELDMISAGIAQQLYQKSSIAAQGFEEANLPDSFFDGVIGNVPFGDF